MEAATESVPFAASRRTSTPLNVPLSVHIPNGVVVTYSALPSPPAIKSVRMSSVCADAIDATIPSRVTRTIDAASST